MKYFKIEIYLSGGNYSTFIIQCVDYDTAYNLIYDAYPDTDSFSILPLQEVKK